MKNNTAVFSILSKDIYKLSNKVYLNFISATKEDKLNYLSKQVKDFKSKARSLSEQLDHKNRELDSVRTHLKEKGKN